MMPSDQFVPSFKPDRRLIAASLQIISGKWRLFIILSLGEQTLRYNQLNDLLPGITPKVLATELKALVELNVFRRDIYADVPVRVEYSLTNEGRSILPMLQQIQQLALSFP